MAAEIIDLAARRGAGSTMPTMPAERSVIRKNERVAFRGIDWQMMSDLAWRARRAISDLEDCMSALVERRAKL